MTGTSAGRTAITITTAVFGGLALVVAGGTAAFAAIGSAASSSESQSVDAAGLGELNVDVDAAGVTVEFADVAEATLEVDGSRGAWTLRRDGDELIVRSPQGFFGGWFFGDWFGGEEHAVLTLPSELEGGLDAEFTLDAGGLAVRGGFDAVDAEVNAGGFEFDGSATELDVSLSAGSAGIDVDGVETAELTVSAGELIAAFTGDAPVETSIEVSAGSLELTVPDEAYAVTQEVSAGDLRNGLQTAASARSSIAVQLSAGSVELRPAD